ncbi:peptidoglycan DD-metalloendopeptidase family protein [Candidatus Gracilibacteria bacterium]|nr:peptidoglycan DD-metalloendopeptidase family protein [Candidatus Gracilibacteria bacterium]
MRAKIKKTVGIFMILLIVLPPEITRSESPKVVYPLQQVSKLECRYENFTDLDGSCKENLKILKTNDYKKYSEQSDGYNDYTRRYSVLWGASYTYGWDVGNGGHMGVDIATSEGTPVYAMADGEIIIAKNKLEFGNLISIKHEINGKKIVSNYAHLSKISVKEGEKVSAGEKIGEVGSTGNSTGNHLHFQIDLQTKSSPAYYSYDTCPYSYNDIVNEGKCFNELQNITVDPLSFLETSGAILNNIVIKEVTVKAKTTTNSTVSAGNASNIFNSTIYIDSSFDDIVEVQKIYKALGYYKGKIDGNYNSVINDIIKYQLDKKIIASKSDDGAGYFGPKTRAQTKIDYNKYLAIKDKDNSVKTEVASGTQKVETISRNGMLTREEIEEREINEFKKKYDIEIQFDDIGTNVGVGTSKKIGLTIKDKKGKGYKGNTPYPISFTVDTGVVEVFPKKFYNFSNGKRDITLTGKKTGNTTLYVKMGSKTIKSVSLKIFDSGKDINPKSAIVLAKSKVIIGNTNEGAIMLKDDKGSRLINLKYNGTFDLKAEGNAKLCIKSGNSKDLKNIMKKECLEKDYVKNKIISYNDTVGGIVVFNYKVFDDQAKIKLYSFNEKKDLITLSIKSDAPKGLTESYAYYDEIITLLENNIATSELKQGYFLEKRTMTEKEAVTWIKDSLKAIKKDTVDKNIIAVIDANIESIEKENVSSFNSITRKDFLDKVYKYLVFNKNTSVSITYRDLENEDNKKANTIFDKTNTWKDKFGENYYQPYQHITRGEGAYVITRAIDRTRNGTLTLGK